jgi:hypothetical protein
MLSQTASAVRASLKIPLPVTKNRVEKTLHTGTGALESTSPAAAKRPPCQTRAETGAV